MDAQLALTLFRVVVGTATLAFFGGWALRRIRYLIALTRAARPNPARSLMGNLRRTLRRSLVNILGNRRLRLHRVGQLAAADMDQPPMQVRRQGRKRRQQQIVALLGHGPADAQQPDRVVGIASVPAGRSTGLGNREKSRP